MTKDNMNIQDDKIKELLSGTKLKAGENLKYRIMHQIEAEKALMHKEQKKAASPNSFIRNMITVFGVMYSLIVIVILGTYLTGGKDALESLTFFAPIILIASICGMFWMISAYDDRRKSKHADR